MPLLHAVPKDTEDEGVALSEEDDRLLRAAFGRYGGGLAERARAADVVARYQQMGAGMWFACGCRPDGRRGRLVPVARSYIRRGQSDSWPEHDETCDFYRDPAEQCQIVKSYTRVVAANTLRLVGPFGEARPALERGFTGASRIRSRPGLAKLLALLVDLAGLQTISPGVRVGSLSDQFAAIRHASEGAFLDSRARLRDFSTTYPKALGNLVSRIDTARPGLFTRNRPHGVLITTLEAVREGELLPFSSPPIPVRGRISVFGEKAPGADRSAIGARAPYLAACVVGRATENGPIEALSAYVHPCAAKNHLMLVDSNYERLTLERLLGLQGWFLKKHGIEMEIEKPVFDIGLDASDEGPVGRGVYIPDFILRVTPSANVACATVIVETMGFADEEYRARKERTHAFMKSAYGDAPLVMHDLASSDRDALQQEFGRSIARAILGAPGGRREERTDRQPAGDGEPRTGAGAGEDRSGR
ncbi:hypothetical protein [Methylosinus sp. LW3]|uniref:hypothetical protein n=1 Tax=Methylosinus sp. LW3 TaxID=107635 RepID=UPI0004664445|nr:hypothetical protein [Methylosinus sp. LW3]